MIKIEQAVNGYVIEYFDDEEKRIYVIEQKESNDGEVRAFRDLVYVLQDLMGVCEGKRSEHCLYHVIAPGISHKDYKGLDFAFWGQYHVPDTDESEADSSVS